MNRLKIRLRPDRAVVATGGLYKQVTDPGLNSPHCPGCGSFDVRVLFGALARFECRDCHRQWRPQDTYRWPDGALLAWLPRAVMPYTAFSTNAAARNYSLGDAVDLSEFTVRLLAWDPASEAHLVTRAGRAATAIWWLFRASRFLHAFGRRLRSTMEVWSLADAELMPPATRRGFGPVGWAARPRPANRADRRRGPGQGASGGLRSNRQTPNENPDGIIHMKETE